MNIKRIAERLGAIPFSKNLAMLAKIYRTDKGNGHHYIPHYDHHLKKYRSRKITLLEIGVGGYDTPHKGGKSLRMWRDYFPYAQVYSIDIHDKSAHEGDRIRILQGSQVDENFLKKLLAETGPLDIIIDDGSHINEHVIKSFELLFPHLKDGGMYVVEDTQTSYWPKFGGTSKDIQNSATMMNYFKHLTDSLNYKEFLIEDYQPTYYDQHIIGMHFYHNLIFIEKGLNEEASNIRQEDRGSLIKAEE